MKEKQNKQKTEIRRPLYSIFQSFLKTDYNKYVRKDETIIKFNFFNTYSFLWNTFKYTINLLNNKFGFVIVCREKDSLDEILTSRNKDVIMSLKTRLKNYNNNEILIMKFQRFKNGELKKYSLFIFGKEGVIITGIHAKIF